jgi:glucokinase
MRNLYIGVDLGGTKTTIVVSEGPPAVLGRVEFPTQPEQGPQPAIQAMFEAIDQLLARHAGPGTAIAGIGVSCGSPLDRIRGVIQAPPNMATWVDVPIRQILEERFNVPCRVENDANAGAVAEHRYGAGQGTQHMVFLTLGTGLGAGIIIHGRVYHGAEDSAGEIGHVRLTRTGPVGYNKAGSVEGWASGGGMARLGARMLATAARRGESSLLCARNGDASLTAKEIAEAAQAGDKLALRIVAASGCRLGEAIAILIDVLNPQRIVLGGMARRFGSDLLKPMRKVVEREALPQALRDCEIVPAAFGPQIGDVAALCVALGFVGVEGEEVRPPEA